MLSGILLAFSGVFYQAYYIPKLLVLFTGSLASAVILLQREELRLPARRTLLFLAGYLLLLGIMASFSGEPRHAYLQLLYAICGCAIYLATVNASDCQKTTALKLACGVALIQCSLAALQAVNAVPFLPSVLIPVEGRLTGTVGNPEFLATLLGVSTLIVLYFREKSESEKVQRWLVAVAAALFLGIIAIGSKGTILYLALYGIWRFKRSVKLIVAGAMAFVLLMLLFSPASVLGRAFLWLTSLRMFMTNPVAGVGLGQFENNYLQTVHGIFSSLPAIAGYFGSYTSLTQDAHNICLQHAAELGLPGLGFSLLFSIFVFRRAQALGGYLGAALFLLLYKSMYTVMLNSPTNLLLLTLLLGVSENPARLRSIKVKPIWTTVLIPVFSALILAGTHLCIADYHYQRGLRAAMLGNSATAKKDFITAINIDPERADTYLALAYLDFLAGNTGEMSLRIDQALKRGKSMDTYKISAHMFFYSRIYGNAERIYSHILFLFPEHLTSMAKLSVIAIGKGDYAQGVSLAEKILALKPRRPNASDIRNAQIASEIVHKYAGGIK